MMATDLVIAIHLLCFRGKPPKMSVLGWCLRMVSVCRSVPIIILYSLKSAFQRLSLQMWPGNVLSYNNKVRGVVVFSWCFACAWSGQRSTEWSVVNFWNCCLCACFLVLLPYFFTWALAKQQRLWDVLWGGFFLVYISRLNSWGKRSLLWGGKAAVDESGWSQFRLPQNGQ